MKTKGFLKAAFVTAMFLGLGWSAEAQITVTNAQLATRPTYVHTPFNAANYELSPETETATVGAKMPYQVDRDQNVNGTFFDASTFLWNWTGITGLEDYSSSTAITSGVASSYNFVVATMPANAGTATLKTQEKSNPKVGTGCTDPTGKTVTITVVDKPTLVLTAGSTGGCDVVDNNLDLVLTGTAPFYVDYEISAVGIDGSTVVGTTKTYLATLSASTDKLLIDDTQLADVSGQSTVAATTAGKYTVKVTKVWDKYSYKAINRDLLAVNPTVNTYDIYVYPKPTTKAIQYIKQQ